VIGQRFAVAKRLVALLCVGLCMALSTQMTIVVLDRMKHVFQIEHAPTALAGPVFDHGHHLTVDVQHVPEQGHEDDHHLAVVHGDHDRDVQPAANHTHGHDGDSHDHDVQQVAYHTHDGGIAHSHGDADQPSATHHSHDGLPQGHDHGPITHHHHGSGVLTPWLVSSPLQLAMLPVTTAVFHYGVTGHPDAPAWRRDRPPKLHLERIV
jgi:hypothetical protein